MGSALLLGRFHTAGRVELIRSVEVEPRRQCLLDIGVGGPHLF
jgi:hypothetical protein